MESVLCAAVDTASDQHGLEACIVYGRSGDVLIKDKVALNLSALH
jgi:hypothetical protein